MSAEDPDVRRRELELLGVFADLCGLTRDRRTADRDHGLEERSPREHFNAYLRSFDADAEGLPDRFRERLLDALAHYGISSLERSPHLEAAAFRIHLAAQRRQEQIPVITALLERRLDHCGEPAERDRVRDTLDRVIASSQSRYPSIGNLARSVRHRCVDRPLLDVARRAAEDDVHDTLDELLRAPDDPEVVTRLVASPMPITPLICRADAFALSIDTSAALAEVLTRRYYKIRALRDIRRRAEPRPIVTAWYHHRGRDVSVVAAAGELADAGRDPPRAAPADRRGQPVHRGRRLPAGGSRAHRRTPSRRRSSASCVPPTCRPRSVAWRWSQSRPADRPHPVRPPTC